jgi:peptidoglycan/LPS O-acetylase OafA/YrhL
MTGAVRIDPRVVLLFDLFCATVSFGLFAGNPHLPPQFGAAAAFFSIGLATSQPRSMWRYAIDTPLLRAFGRCCYSIYLFHLVALYALDSGRSKILALLHMDGFGPTVTMAVWFVLFAALCLAGGSVLFYGFEKPMVLLGRHVIARLQASSAPRRAMAST